MCVVLLDALTSDQYGFFSKVFNLPSMKTVLEYNTINGNSPCGMLYNVLEKRGT